LLPLRKSIKMTKLKKTKEPVILKKQKYPEIQLAIENAMLSFKDILGEKKYQNRISKAVKVLMHGINKPKALKSAPIKVENKKLPKKVSTPKKAAGGTKAKIAVTKKVTIKKSIKK